MKAVFRTCKSLAWVFLIYASATPACIRSHDLSKPPLEAELEGIRARLKDWPAVSVRTRSIATGTSVTQAASPLLTISLEGLQLESKQAIVPWNEVQSLSTLDRRKGAKIGVLAGALVGAAFGAGIVATERDCGGQIGCVPDTQLLLMSGLLGAIVGVCTGAAVGYRNTWTSQAP
jgi:hypothetical protein